MKSNRRFPKSVLLAIHKSKILGIRAGKGAHRFTGVWPVVVEGRVFVRSWDDKEGGWHQTILKQPYGIIQVDGLELEVRARKTKSERIMDSIDRAYAEKYPTQASRKYVRGLRLKRRRMTTTEFVPA